MSDDQSKSLSDDEADYHTCDEDDEDEKIDKSRTLGATSSSSSSDDGRNWLDYHHTSDEDDEEEEKSDAIGPAPVLEVKKESSQLHTSSLAGLDQLVSNVLHEHGKNTQVIATSGPHQSGDSLDLATGRSSMASNSGTLIQINANLIQNRYGDVRVGQTGQLNLSMGGEQTINKTPTTSQERKDSTLSRADIINKKTVDKIKSWNQGMVKTAALERVLDKLKEGTTWLTIKGNPGEGKTTAAYMALEELHRAGRQVFEVTTPADFTEVVETSSCPVIVLDDVFGNLEFDQIKWSNWEPVISPLLKEREHKSHADDQSKKDVNVLLTGRGYVLNSASFPSYMYFLRSDKHVVKMDHSMKRDVEEKRAIWETISKSSGVELGKITVDEILRIEGPHGFPHVCRLFTTIFKEDNSISAIDFFRTPLAFLNLSVSNLFRDENKVKLFKEMVKNEGRVMKRKLSDLDPNYKIKQTAESLEGSYLKLLDGSYVFDHPSIYDSVALRMCELEPDFVIKHCHFSFIHERVRLQVPQNEMSASSSNCSLVVFVDQSFADDLADRFVSEIMARNLVQVLSHQAFTDGAFITKVMSKITIPLRRLLFLEDRGYHWFDKTFLSLVASSKSPELLKYIDNCLDIYLSEYDTDVMLHGIFRHAAYDVLTYLIRTRKSFDINKKFQLDRDKTPLMIAAATRDEKFVEQILSLKPDLNVTDKVKKTAFHHFCENGLVSAISRVIESGFDINIKDKFKESPLCCACASNQLEVAKLLIEKGANVDELSLYLACFSGNIEIVKLLFEKEQSFKDKNILNRNLPGAIQGDSVDILKLFLDKGASVNTLEANLFSLHAACIYNNPKALKWLLQQGAEIDHVDKDGNTAVNVAVQWEHKECLDVMLQTGASLDLPNNKGDTALHNAIWRRTEESVQWLVRKGANVNAQDAEGNTPLHQLTSLGSCQCLDMMGKSVSLKVVTYDKHGVGTPQENEEFKWKERVPLLLEAGADVNIQNEVGDTVLHKAFNTCSPTVPDLDVCIMLIQARPNVNTQNKDGDTPLHLLHLLPLRYMDVHRFPQFVRDWVTAHYKKLVKILIDSGADGNIRNKVGRKALETVNIENK